MTLVLRRVRADPPEAGQPQRGLGNIESEREPEYVDLQPLLRGDDDPEETKER
jgi:hypothetical protein